MKLRIRGNSLRLRLSQKEVAQLADKGRVEDVIAIGPSKLAYALVLGDRIAATYEGSRIEVTVPKDRARAWSTNDAEVGIENDDDALKILVEKDWSCLKPREGEDDSDAYPHPKAGA